MWNLPNMLFAIADHHPDSSSPRMATPEEDDDAITINVVKPSADERAGGVESQPLLQQRKKSAGKKDGDAS